MRKVVNVTDYDQLIIPKKEHKEILQAIENNSSQRAEHFMVRLFAQFKLFLVDRIKKIRKYDDIFYIMLA